MLQTKKIIDQITFIFIALYIVLSSSYVFAIEQEDLTILASIDQIKHIVMNQQSEKDILQMIARGIERGAKGLKIARSDVLQDMGWLFEDSKRREVFRIYFTFIDNKVHNGRYIAGPLSEQAPKGSDMAILSWHKRVLYENFQEIGKDKYNVGNGCVATLQFFKYRSRQGRTVIAVDCH